MKVVSLFSGCGGMDLGFEQAGFSVVWANEFDRSILETYKINHPKTILCDKDIRTIASSEIPECDGIIGGPPCQSWSIGGRQKGLDDERGRLFFDYIRIVEEKSPKFFLIENVPGILQNRHKEAFNSFLTRLNNAGYNIDYALLNSADYKIPQDRYRVFIVGIRHDIKCKYIFPKAQNTEKVTLHRAIGDITDMPQFTEGPVVNVRTTNGFYNHDVYVGKFSSNYMHSNRVRGWDETSYTIQAQAANAPIHPQAPKMVACSNGGKMFKRGYEQQYRRLSVRECARIQTFPDSFRFVYSNIFDGYKMVGNAVPPRMAYFLANEFSRIFGLPYDKSSQTYKRLNLEKMKLKNPSIFLNNVFNGDFCSKDANRVELDKHVLIGLVKSDNASHFDSHSGKIYYTGKRFPSTIALNKLYYFMPYIKGQGVRDLYVINIARIGSKNELFPNSSSDSDLRLIFEISFVTQLFHDYIPLNLNIWHTFTDVIAEDLISCFRENYLPNTFSVMRR